ncbi:MAG: large subunit ribosomal protein L24 [Verrucomicrobiales bacterium]|jgi:large subunit ribosomal protein L24
MSKYIKTHVNRDDLVEVIAGAHKGKTGKVLQVYRGKSQVVVEGIRMVKKHTRKSQEAEGGIIEREGPIHISNVKLATAAKSAS